MDIDLWLIEHSMKTDFKGDTLKDVDAIPTQDLKELLKTHSIVPNEPVAVVEVWNQGGSGEFVTASGIELLSHGTKLYILQEDN